MKSVFFKTLVFLSVLGALIVSGVGYVYYKTIHPSTDDAYLRASLINIAPQVSGPVINVAVSPHDAVEAGQLLFEIDPKPFEIAVMKAEAQLQLARQSVKSYTQALDSARSKVKQAEANYLEAQQSAQRILALVKTGQLSLAQGDDAQRKLDVAKAALAASKSSLEEAVQKLGTVDEANPEIQLAKAALEEAQLQLSYTKIYAPAPGTLVNFDLRVGAMLSAGRPLFALVEKDDWWIEANFKETDLKRIKPGQAVKIKFDMYPKKIFDGTVDAVSQGSGSAFALLPPENATGNWVKVVQRFEVRIKFKTLPDMPLRVGASMFVRVNTEDSANAAGELSFWTPIQSVANTE